MNLLMKEYCSLQTAILRQKKKIKTEKDSFVLTIYENKNSLKNNCNSQKNLTVYEKTYPDLVLSKLINRLHNNVWPS
jgi:hypothetical protein